jgi:hypothetical protein
MKVSGNQFSVISEIKQPDGLEIQGAEESKGHGAWQGRGSRET